MASAGTAGFPGAIGERGRAGPAGPAGPRGPSSPTSQDANGGLQPVEKVRTEFPETWIWLNEIVGYISNYTASVEIPSVQSILVIGGLKANIYLMRIISE